MASKLVLAALAVCAVAAGARAQGDASVPAPSPDSKPFGTATMPSTKDACPGTSSRAGFVGGWQMVARQDPLVTEAMQVATDEFISEQLDSNTTDWEPCDDYVALPQWGCVQVVAGMNVKVNYRVYCPAPDTVTGFAPNPLRIMATVYFPLPASNEVPEVVELEILTYAQQPLTIKV